MTGERMDIPPSTPPAGGQEQPTPGPPCARNLYGLLKPETGSPTPEQLDLLHKQSLEQTGSTCIGCLEDPLLDIVEREGCPAKNPSTVSVIISKLHEPTNRAPRRRIQHILENTRPTAPIPGLDSEASRIIGDKKDAEIGSDTTTEYIPSPQAWPDMGRGVDPETLKDLGY